MIPKIFIPKKYSKKKIEELTQDYNPSQVSLLLESCEEFIGRHKEYSRFGRKYRLGWDLVRDLNYTTKDLETVSSQITTYKDDDRLLGFHLSVLVNKIITEQDTIKLKLNTDLRAVGAYLKKGHLIIETSGRYPTRMDDVGAWMLGGQLTVKGDAGSNTGLWMSGGHIMIIGNSGNGTGRGMQGGKIDVSGTLWGYTGTGMRKGIIRAKEIKNIDWEYIHGGTIWKENKIVFSK